MLFRSFFGSEDTKFTFVFFSGDLNWVESSFRSGNLLLLLRSPPHSGVGSPLNKLLRISLSWIEYKQGGARVFFMDLGGTGSNRGCFDGSGSSAEIFPTGIYRKVNVRQPRGISLKQTVEIHELVKTATF